MHRVLLYRYLPLVLLVFFVCGCAAPKSIAPAGSAEKSVEQAKKIDKKKAAKKKVANSKKRKSAVAEKKKKSQEELPAAGTVSSIEEGPAVVGRMMYHYDYYPATEVYFDTIRHLYFYQDKGRWMMSVALPVAFQTEGTSVRLKLKTSQPYTLHREHRKLYP